MSASRLRKCLLLLLAVLILLPVFACADLERVVEEEAARQREELERKAEDAARSWLDRQFETIKSLPGQLWDNIKQRLGFKDIEIPEAVGHLAPELEGQFEAEAVRNAYVEAFKDLGGAAKIGEPQDLVHDWDGMLAQSFQKGDSATLILWHRHSPSAYSIGGPWLERFRALGGPTQAGWPVSHAERWGYPGWLVLFGSGRGQVQRFVDPSGRAYGLMWADGTESIHVVSPPFWEAYEAEGGPTDLGYPVSSYPLTERDIHDVPGLSEDEKQMLEFFQDQPERTMVFQRGAIVVDVNTDATEILYKQELSGGEMKLLLGALGVLADKCYMEIDSSEECNYVAFSMAANMVDDEFVERALRRISLIPLTSALAVTQAETWAGKLLLGTADLLLSELSGEDRIPSFLSAFGGQVVGVIYPHLFGDILELPLGVAADASIDQIAQESYDHMKETLIVSLAVEEGQITNRFGDSTGANLVLVYNPYTHLVTIILRADCADELYVGQYRANGEALPVDNGLIRFWRFPSGDSF